MPEKMFSFTHLISETKLLALIASNADEVKVDIFTPERRGAKPKLNGAPSPLMIPPPKKEPRIDKTLLAKQWRVLRWGARQLILQTLYEHKDTTVTVQELIAAGQPYAIGAGALSVTFPSMIKDGMIARVEKGTYKILDKGMEIAFAAAQAVPVEPVAQTQAGVGSGNYSRGVPSVGQAIIWAEAIKGDKFKREPFLQAFEDAGLNRGTVGGSCAAMVKTGMIQLVSRGVYRITAKGKKLAEQQQQPTSTED